MLRIKFSLFLLFSFGFAGTLLASGDRTPEMEFLNEKLHEVSAADTDLQAVYEKVLDRFSANPALFRALVSTEEKWWDFWKAEALVEFYAQERGAFIEERHTVLLNLMEERMAYLKTLLKK